MKTIEALVIFILLFQSGCKVLGPCKILPPRYNIQHPSIPHKYGPDNEGRLQSNFMLTLKPPSKSMVQ